jgi:short subunit dehydrogenase-like uncharacterized protein
VIFVYGASGWMGSLITKALLERKHAVTVSGRDPARLELLRRHVDGKVEIKSAPIHDADALTQAMRGARVVINCAGPFVKTGEPVLAAALAAGAHYVDIAGEQRFFRTIYERYESRARHAGVTIVCGMGFGGALGDWAASLAREQLIEKGASEDEPLSDVAIAYTIDRFKLAPGTLDSVLSQLEYPPDMWLEDRWEPLEPVGEIRRFFFPKGFGPRETVSFPSPEVITVPRHIPTRRVVTYLALAGDASLAVWMTRAAAALSPVMPALLRSPIGAMARAQVISGSAGPSPADRQATRFAIVCEARQEELSARVAVTGSDPYALSVELSARAAGELEKGKVPAGVLAPSECFPAKQWLTALADEDRIEVFAS